MCSAQVAHKAKLTYSEKSGKKVKFARRKNPQEQLKKFILLPTYSYREVKYTISGVYC